MPATPALVPQASAIVEQLPTLIECALRCDIENNHLQIECTKYRAIIQELEGSISHERTTQRSLRRQIHTIRGTIRCESRSPSIIASPNTSIATIRSADVKNSEMSSVPSALVDLAGSPVSLRTKRKGIVFDDDLQIVKRAKLDGP